jgi:hypothetical protein
MESKKRIKKTPSKEVYSNNTPEKAEIFKTK